MSRSVPIRLHLLALAASSVVVAMVLGCNFDVNKSGEPGNKNVKITTPVGDLSVRNEADAADTGLPVYPGSTPKPKEGNDNHSANINISTSFFGLKVVAVTFLSDDPPDKIVAFYRDKLTRFGKVTECRGNIDFYKKNGENGVRCKSDRPERTDGGFHIQTGEKNETNLGTGTEDDQHLVSVKEHGKGSEFSVVHVRTHGDKQETM